jgi:hyperosmotically inducible periplasmic protein
MARQQSTREAINDGVITAKVKAALNAGELADYDIHVETVASVVRLTGFVETRIVRDEALQRTRSVQGVQDVDDELDIRRPGSA